MQWIEPKKALRHNILSIDGIMQKVHDRELLTVPEEEYLYHHGTVAQVCEAFKDYPVVDVL